MSSSASSDDRFFHNVFPRDIGDNKDKIMDSDNKKLSREYLERARKNLEVLQKTLDVGVARGDGRDDFSVYTGTSGYSLLYLHLAKHRRDSAYLKKASSILKKALRHLKGRRPSFLCGDPGPLVLAALLHHREGDDDMANDCIARIKRMKEDILNPASGLPDEILYGRAGYLYALLLVQHEIGHSAVEDSLVRGVVAAILDSGRSLARQRKSSVPLLYQWHDKDYLGAAHGTAGILFMLMQAKEHLTKEELDEIVRPTIDYLASLLFRSGNLPSSLGNDRDRLVQWCHGAPGAVYLFGKAYQVFGDESYLKEAKRSGECVWERGILRKGYGLCHGTAGNGYALLYLYQVTHDPNYLYQAAQFGLWCQDYGIHGCRTADRPLSLYEGLAAHWWMPKKMLGRAAFTLLEEAGCCRRCALVFLGDRTDSLYKDIPKVNEAIEAAVNRLDGHSDEVQNSMQHSRISETVAVPECFDNTGQILSDEETVKMETQESRNSTKKQKFEACVACIGVLQWGCSKEAIKRLSDAIKDGGHDADGFSLSLSLPVSISLRVHRLWSLLLKACPQFPVQGREDHIGTLKDIWKNVVGPQLEAATGKTFIHGIYHDFVLNVVCSYVNDLEDCKIMDELCCTVFAARQKQHKKYANSVYSKQAVDAAFKKLSDSDLLKVCPEPPSTPSEVITFATIQCQQAPLYIAGRYNKYSRDLPQTPWFVEGERKMGSSVQELICDTVNQTVYAEDMKFSSSGREDVDVRCLGNGRPFVVEFLNPQRTKLSREEISSLQMTINNSTKLIRVRDLQIVEKKDLKNLKEGEEEKTKAYCALCIAPNGYDCSALEALSMMPQVVIQQKTPLRVLHRRPLATRPRAILSIRAQPVDQHFFKLHLTTQAGTYIKEFVHGDLGRTVPNLGEILGCEVDIIALDVESVALDWPPKCSD